MKLKLEKTKAFWLYIVGGVLSIALGIMLMPFWNSLGKDVFFKTWGGVSVNIMISGLLLAYVLLYLVKRIKRYAGTPAQIVAIVELVLMVVISVVCTVSMFVDEISFGDPCQIFGLVLWARGASGVFTGYYCDSEFVAELDRKNKEKKKAKKGEKEKIEEIDTDEEPRGRVDDFTVWRLTLAILLISLGTYMFIKPPFGALLLQWVFSGIISAVGLFFTVFGCAMKPKRVKVEEKKVQDNVNVDVNLDTKKDSLNTNDNSGSITNKDENGNEIKALEGAKVKIKLDNSANAMTNTATIDAVTDGGEESKQEPTALVPVSDEKKKKKA